MNLKKLEQLCAVARAKLTWRPKHPQTSAPCASCPFRHGNDRALGAVIQGLTGSPPTKAEIRCARVRVKRDVEQSGEFLCHRTVYRDGPEPQFDGSVKQCSGATGHYREFWERRAKRKDGE